jgi:hypothetical protein
MADALLIHRVMMAAEQWQRLSLLPLPLKVVKNQRHFSVTATEWTHRNDKTLCTLKPPHYLIYI